MVVKEAGCSLLLANWWNMESIGDYLRTERELRNISLEAVANATKISVSILRAIEEGQQDVLPAQVFVRGFIRCYAEYIGLDPNDVASRSRSPGRAEIPEEHDALEMRGTELLRYNKKSLWIFALAAALVLSLGFIIYIVSKSSPSQQGGPEKGEVVIRSSQGIHSTGDSGTVETRVLAESEGLSLRNEARDTQTHVLQATFKANTWIRAIVDDKAAEEYSFRAGESFSWAMNGRIRLIIGNAGGVDFTLDGRPMKPLGESGQVVQITLPDPTLM